jgi:hypothetical protein
VSGNGLPATFTHHEEFGKPVALLRVLLLILPRHVSSAGYDSRGIVEAYDQMVVRDGSVFEVAGFERRK